MRKVINGKTYNTATSKKLGSWNNGHSMTDFGHCEEGLFKNTMGAYFLHAEGGPMSRNADRSGANFTWGDKLVPMSRDEADAWAQEYLETEEYEKEFGIHEEATPSDSDLKERANFSLDQDFMTSFRKLSEENGIKMSTMVFKAVTSMYMGGLGTKATKEFYKDITK